MKRTFLLCATLLLLGDCAVAQKANVNKLKNKIASTPIKLDFSNLEAEKVQELRDLIEPALTNPESKDMHQLWEYAARMKMHDMNEMLQARAANNNQFADINAFFDNQYDIVAYCERYQQLITTPNAKGKLPLKEDEQTKKHNLMQQLASGPRGNLLVAASNMVNEQPEKAMKFLDLYYASFSDPLFADAPKKEGEEAQMNDSYYIYATALKNTKGDAAKRKEYLSKATASANYGKNALYELMEAAKADGDMATWKTLCDEAMNKYPDEGLFGRALLQQYVNDKEYDKATALADKLIANNEAQGKQDEWPYHFKAIANFNQDKLEVAYECFTKAAEAKPDFADAFSSAGTTAWKMAQNSAKDKQKSTEWYNKAIENFEKAREAAPDRSDLWGYSLYAVYNNSGNTKKAAEFKKYDTNK